MTYELFLAKVLKAWEAVEVAFSIVIFPMLHLKLQSTTEWKTNLNELFHARNTNLNTFKHDNDIEESLKDFVCD